MGQRKYSIHVKFAPIKKGFSTLNILQEKRENKFIEDEGNFKVTWAFTRVTRERTTGEVSTMFFEIGTIGVLIEAT